MSQQVALTIDVKVAPWVERYLRMVDERSRRTQQLPLMDIVERVIRRGLHVVR